MCGGCISNRFAGTNIIHKVHQEPLTLLKFSPQTPSMCFFGNMCKPLKVFTYLTPARWRTYFLIECRCFNFRYSLMSSKVGMTLKVCFHTAVHRHRQDQITAQLFPRHCHRYNKIMIQQSVFMPPSLLPCILSILTVMVWKHSAKY